MKISNDILAILDSCQIEGNAVRLTCGQLDRKTYESVNKVLTAIGGKWNRKAQGHIFDDDPVDVFQEVILTGEYARKRQDYGFFETPLSLAEQVMALADLKPNHSILEPSAGKGALLLPLGFDTYHIETIEIQPENCRTLRNLNYHNECTDFLSMKPEECDEYDRILMNPPFAVPGNPQADIDHVLHAFKFLSQGGRLVSIMSSGVTFRTNKKTENFRAWLAENDAEIHQNPDGAFKESGTMVNTVTVVMEVLK